MPHVDSVGAVIRMTDLGVKIARCLLDKSVTERQENNNSNIPLFLRSP